MYVKIQIRFYYCHMLCYTSLFARTMWKDTKSQDLSMHIVHNMRQSPTSAAFAVSCIFHIKLFLVARKQYYFSVFYFLSHI